ncbi:MAG: acyltransferase [Planctomycetota bacterium]
MQHKSDTKEDFLSTAEDTHRTARQKYQDLVVGDRNLWPLIKHEFLVTLLSNIPGAIGFVLRQKFYRSLFRAIGRGVVIGKNVTLQRASQVGIGDNALIDDGVCISVRGDNAQIIVGQKTLIGRGSTLQVRSGTLQIGEHVSIGNYCRIATASGLVIGRYSLISAFCYVGATNHRFDRTDIPMIFQGAQDKGGVIIEEDVWIGAHVVVLDGVRIGKGSVIGSCSLVTKNIPDYAIAYGIPAKVHDTRKKMV